MRVLGLEAAMFGLLLLSLLSSDRALHAERGTSLGVRPRRGGGVCISLCVCFGPGLVSFFHGTFSAFSTCR